MEFSKLKNYEFTPKEISEMESKTNLSEVSEREKVHFLFSLGKAYEDVGNFDKSFEYYKKGNDLNRGRTTYDPKAIEALSDRLKNFLLKIHLKSAKILVLKQMLLFL